MVRRRRLGRGRPRGRVRRRVRRRRRRGCGWLARRRARWRSCRRRSRRPRRRRRGRRAWAGRGSLRWRFRVVATTVVRPVCVWTTRARFVPIAAAAAVVLAPYRGRPARARRRPGRRPRARAVGWPRGRGVRRRLRRAHGRCIGPHFLGRRWRHPAAPARRGRCSAAAPGRRHPAIATPRRLAHRRRQRRRGWRRHVGCLARRAAPRA